MIIGVPKEIMRGEKRVSATPETVEKLVKSGARVIVENSAGIGASFADSLYAQAGAELAEDVREIYKRAEIILKVKEPQFNEKYGLHEIDMMHEGQMIFTFIHPASPANHQMVRDMAKKGVIGLTLDGLPRIPSAERMDPLITMSKCGGYKGMIMGIEALPRFTPRMVTAVGTAEPANALVVGVGVGGLAALTTAKNMGANVFAADVHPRALETARLLGAEIIELGVPQDIALKEGSARTLPGDFTQKAQEALAKVLPQMDLVFLGALVPSKMAPILITEEMVKTMRPGSVIIDLSIDQGGNCEITPSGGTEVLHGVTIIGIKNLPGMLPESSSWMFAQNVYELVSYLTHDDRIVLNQNDPIVQGILTTFGGEVVHEGAKEAMGMV